MIVEHSQDSQVSLAFGLLGVGQIEKSSDLLRRQVSLQQPVAARCVIARWT
jgi:hypothetical protein